MRTIFRITILTLLCFSCSNRAAKEKALKDLEVYQQKVTEFRADVEGGQNRLRVMKENLVVAQDRLNQVGGFQLLRTPQERDQQLRAATDGVLEAQQKIKDSESMILAWSDSVSSTEAKIARTKEILKD